MAGVGGEEPADPVIAVPIAFLKKKKNVEIIRNFALKFFKIISDRLCSASDISIVNSFLCGCIGKGEKTKNRIHCFLTLS